MCACFPFTKTSTTKIYTLSLHDALPIYHGEPGLLEDRLHLSFGVGVIPRHEEHPTSAVRSEEHTSELQSRRDLVCRLLLEKKKSQSSTRRRINTEGVHHLVRQSQSNSSS